MIFWTFFTKNTKKTSKRATFPNPGTPMAQSRDFGIGIFGQILGFRDRDCPGIKHYTILCFWFFRMCTEKPKENFISEVQKMIQFLKATLTNKKDHMDIAESSVQMEKWIFLDVLFMEFSLEIVGKVWLEVRKVIFLWWAKSASYSWVYLRRSVRPNPLFLGSAETETEPDQIFFGIHLAETKFYKNGF